jgi:Sulfotransferase domain
VGANLFISYPKSGRTWLRVMFDALEIKFTYEHMGTGSARPDWGRRWRGIDPDLDLSAWSRIVFLYRDPRDVVVSFFHQMLRRETLTVGERLRFWLSRRLPPLDIHRFAAHPGFGVARVAQFNLDWMSRLSSDPCAILLSYEELQCEPFEAMAALLDFLRAPHVTDEALRHVIDRCSFHRMQEDERSGAYAKRYGSVLLPGDVSDPDSYKVRRGQVGGYLDEMPPGTIDYADRVLAGCDYFVKVEQFAAASPARSGSAALAR